MVYEYWDVGRQITEAIGERAEYGKQLLRLLSDNLTNEFGKGYDESNLRKMRQFYSVFNIRHTLRSELSWSHYRLLMRVDEPMRREFYLNECEFLDLKENKDYHESELEQALIDKLQEFLLELGKGFSYVGRQKRITTDHGNHYYIDLVFYNYILKCFVVIDLKTEPLSYQDIGQIDFYTRLFDDKVKQDNDAPTIGIVLCTDKDESMVKYSILADKEYLYAANYMSYLPTEEELKAKIIFEREAIERRLLLEKEGDAE